MQNNACFGPPIMQVSFAGSDFIMSLYLLPQKKYLTVLSFGLSSEVQELTRSEISELDHFAL